jgi:hypothetical protein
VVRRKGNQLCLAVKVFIRAEGSGDVSAPRLAFLGHPRRFSWSHFDDLTCTECRQARSLNSDTFGQSDRHKSAQVATSPCRSAPTSSPLIGTRDTRQRTLRQRKWGAGIFVVILRASTISLPAICWLVGSELTYRRRSLRVARLA